MKGSLGIDPAVAILLEKSSQEEIDYGFVMDCLKNYKDPRKKLNHLLKINALVRVKKGIYVFGEKFARRPISTATLANMIYGPSYVSLEWACRYYNLIPEEVTTVTSVTMKRSKEFKTPIAFFTYDHLPVKTFSIGVTLISFSETQSALIAMKEKAVADLLVLRRGHFNSMKHFKETLFEDLRFDAEDIDGLDLRLLQEIYQARPHSAVKYLIECVQDE